MPDTSPTSLSLQHTSRVEMYPLLIRLFPSLPLLPLPRNDERIWSCRNWTKEKRGTRKRGSFGRKAGDGRLLKVTFVPAPFARCYRSPTFSSPSFPSFLFSGARAFSLRWWGTEERGGEDTGIVARNRNIREIYVWKYNIWKRRSFDGWRAIRKIRNIYFC